jgi:RES domain-containing protein
LFGGRWNHAGIPVIYAGSSFAISALEILVHVNTGSIPQRFNDVCADIPDDIASYAIGTGDIPGWDGSKLTPARLHGSERPRGQRGLVVYVPSAVTNGLDRNVLINPARPDFARIRVSAETEVVWDPRLRMSGA